MMILLLILPSQIVLSLCALIMLECVVLTYDYQHLLKQQQQKKKEYIPKSRWKRKLLTAVKSYGPIVAPVLRRWHIQNPYGTAG
jgi:hypothetical protein